MAEDKGKFPINKNTPMANDGSHIKLPLKDLSGGSVVKTPPKPTSTGSKK
jgi:hypothetical protein